MPLYEGHNNVPDVNPFVGNNVMGGLAYKPGRFYFSVIHFLWKILPSQEHRNRSVENIFVENNSLPVFKEISWYLL